MATRAPYGAFNFIVTIDSDEFGGFSDVSGLNTEMTVAEYRAGNDAENHVRKVPGLHKVGDVTLKRGIVNSSDFWEWIDAVRVIGVEAQRDVVITLLNESREPIQTWKLTKAIPLKYSGPTLAAKGGTDVAMEELVLSAEKLEFESAA